MKKISFLIHPEELSKKWVDRMVECGISILGLHPVGGKDANISLQKTLQLLDTNGFRELIDYAALKGLEIEYEMHAMRYLLPSSEFDKHPEWFRMNAEGIRTADWNFCVSNEEALEYAAENAAQLAKKLYRSTKRYYFWMDDARDSFCHCPKCLEMSASDQQLKVLNRMLSRLKKDDDKAELAYLAYCDTINAPTTIKPCEGIFLEYAPFERDFDQPVENHMQTKAIPELLHCFDRSSARILEYWYDNSLYSKWKKPPRRFVPNKDVIRADFAYYTKKGFHEIASFACFLGDDYEALYGEFDISDIAAFIKQTEI